MRTVPVLVALAGLAAAAAAAPIEPILYTNGEIPGVSVETSPGVLAPATIWQTGLFRPQVSPDKSRWAIRINNTSASFNEYIVVGSGTSGSTVLFTTGDINIVPSGIPSIPFISERGLAINDNGDLAVSGATTGASTNAIWSVPASGAATLIVQENNPAFERPSGLGDFRDISSPSISNSGKIAFAESDGASAAFEQVILWDAGAFSELAAEFETLSNVPGRLIQNINNGEANAQRGSVFFFEDAGGANRVFGFTGDLDGTTTDDHFVALEDSATGDINAVYREADVVDGQSIFTIPVGWVDAQGNTFAVPAAGFGALADMFAFINGEAVLRSGDAVGGTVPGETFLPGNPGFLVSPVVALDRNSLGGYIIGATTDNTDTFDANGSTGVTTITKNQVIIYVAPDGTRTELLRIGDSVTVDVNGASQERRIVNLGQQDAAFGAFVDDTHLYVLAATEPFAGTVPADLFARVALPTTGGACSPADISSAATPGVPDGVLTGADFFEFLNRFGAGDLSIDFSSPANPGVPDGVLTGADFFEFLSLFAAGC